jgi:hypothetical protein
MIMDGNFNAPFIFFRFYAGDDGCLKCSIFGGYDNFKPTRRQLYALKPETLAKAPLAFETRDTIHYKDGSIAFAFVVFTDIPRQPIGASR